MIMGQAAGSAAALAARSGVDVQRVDMAALHAVLRANGVIFRPPPAPPGTAASPSTASTPGSIANAPAAAPSVPVPAIPGPMGASGHTGPVPLWLAVEGGLIAVFLMVFVIWARARRTRPPTA
jgi:hypothetical protein